MVDNTDSEEAQAILAQELPQARFGSGRNVRAQQQALLTNKRIAQETLRQIQQSRQTLPSLPPSDPQAEINRVLTEQADFELGVRLAVAQQERGLVIYPSTLKPAQQRGFYAQQRLTQQAVQQAKAEYKKQLAELQKQASDYDKMQSRLPAQPIGSTPTGYLFPDKESPTGARSYEAVATTPQGDVMLTQRPTPIQQAPVIQPKTIDQPTVTEVSKRNNYLSQIKANLKQARDTYSTAILGVKQKVEQLERKAIKGTNPQGYAILEFREKAYENINKEIDDYNRNVTTFNQQYRNRTLSEVDFDRSLEESQRIDRLNQTIAEQQVDIEKAIAAAERKQEQQPYPSRILTGFTEGIQVAPLAVTSLALGVIALDKQSIKDATVFLPKMETYSSSGEAAAKINAGLLGKEGGGSLAKFIRDPGYFTAQLAGAQLSLGAVPAIRAELNKPIIIRVRSAPTTFKAIDAIQPIIKDSVQKEYGTFTLRSDTPAQFAKVDTLAKQYKRTIAEKFFNVRASPVQEIATQVYAENLPETILLRDAETRFSIGNIITKGGVIEKGEVVSKRASQSGTLTDISKLYGRQDAATIDPNKARTKFGDLTKIETKILKEGIAKDTPILSKDIDFFKGELESYKIARFTKKTGKGFEEFSYRPTKAGGRTTRSVTLSAVREEPLIQLEGFDLYNTKVGLKDITRSPSTRGKVSTIQGASIVKEPLILETDISENIIKRATDQGPLKTQVIEKSAVKKAALITKSAETISAKELAAKSSGASRASLSRLTKRLSAGTEFSRIQSLPVAVGGSGRTASDYGGGFQISEEEAQPLSVSLDRSLSKLEESPKAKTITLSRSFQSSGLGSGERSIQSSPALSREDSLSKELSKNLIKSLSKSLTKPAEKTVQKELSKTQQKQQQKQLSKLITKQITKLTPKEPPPSLRPPGRTPGRTPPLAFGFGLASDKNLSRLSRGFSVKVRRRGKFRTIATNIPLGRAYQVGQKKVLTSLAATFKLEETGKLTSLPDIESNLNSRIFRKPSKRSSVKDLPLTFIQRTRKEGGLKSGRLSSVGERKEIKSLRKLAATPNY